MKQTLLHPKFTYAYLGAILLISLAIRINFLDLPFERDEGVYAHFGTILMDGGLPYQDFEDTKPPGLFYMYALLMSVFGRTVEGLHAAFILINLCTALLLFFTGRKLYGAIGGLAAAGSFTMLSLIPHAGGMSVLSEHLVIFFVSAGLLLLVHFKEQPNQWLAMFAGIAFGLALMVKQNGLFFIAAAGLYLLIRCWKHGMKAVFLNLLTFTLWAFIPSGLMVVWLIKHDVMEGYLYWNIHYPMNNIHDVSSSEAWGYVTYIVSRLWEGNQWWWITGLLGVLGIFLPKSTAATRWLMVLLLLFSIASLLPRLTFHGHYFLFLLPSFALLTAAVFASLEQALALRWPQTFAKWVPVVGLSVLVLFHTGVHWRLFFQPNHQQLLREVYGYNPFWEIMEMGKVINDKKQPEDELLVFGGENQLYFYTGLKAPATHHLYGPYMVDGSSAQINRQQEFIKAIEAAPPRFFVATRHPHSWVVKPNANQEIFNWYGNFTRKHYRKTGVIDIFKQGDSKYSWGKEASQYKETGDAQVFLYELK